MSFVIEKPQVTTIPTPYPVTTPWQPIIPLYEHDWRVTCSETNTEQL